MNLIISGDIRNKAVRDALIQYTQDTGLNVIYECLSVLPDHAIKVGDVILLGSSAYSLFQTHKSAMQTKN